MEAAYLQHPVKISIRHLYKVFGEDPRGVLEHVRAGVSKAALMAEYRHVLGLDDINIEINEGQITVVMGLSGSGKSTMIRHLNRLIEPTAGEIWLDGEDIASYGEKALRQLRRERMSMVFQKFALFPHRTVLDNTALAPRVRGKARVEYEDEARRWLQRVGLKGYDDQYPSQLSGGEQQRVGLARALTSNAEIMLMDEAFSALDPLIRTDMQDLLMDLQDELRKTIIFITHDLDEALKLGDYLVILNEGRVVQQDEPQQVLLNPADAYVEDFVSDINRARVLRVRSIMSTDGAPSQPIAGEIDHDDTLEAVIALSGGNTTKAYRVIRNGEPVGFVDMRDLVRALVPSRAAEGGIRAKYTA
jgi:glycine betaine/proline transport system ATP-binding protein